MLLVFYVRLVIYLTKQNIILIFKPHIFKDESLNTKKKNNIKPKKYNIIILCDRILLLLYFLYAHFS